ncbi:hypothetical protein AX774_g3665 [Zancudomyces culisetae]|uniref:Uncharacterized protein n=1 Tax=Zancudomyces culisetae TaxID=1213189 RepID=A0A1R1PPG6_ZANCU|nr:hypothetical protein AX774_g3665 [Zancudomyces culisetae]|eukprot:OMH82840.1 hypothetical protein AX774_g3665 [Zancudomyces culisetae]
MPAINLNRSDNRDNQKAVPSTPQLNENRSRPSTADTKAEKPTKNRICHRGKRRNQNRRARIEELKRMHAQVAAEVPHNAGRDTVVEYSSENSRSYPLVNAQNNAITPGQKCEKGKLCVVKDHQVAHGHPQPMQMVYTPNVAPIPREYTADRKKSRFTYPRAEPQRGDMVPRAPFIVVINHRPLVPQAQRAQPNPQFSSIRNLVGIGGGMGATPQNYNMGGANDPLQTGSVAFNDSFIKNNPLVVIGFFISILLAFIIYHFKQLSSNESGNGKKQRSYIYDVAGQSPKNSPSLFVSTEERLLP